MAQKQEDSLAFLPVAGNKWLDKTNPYEQSVIHLCEALHSCYQCLSKDVIFGRDLLATRSRQFANLWVAISKHSQDPFWRVKPKLHQFQHLCETTGSMPTESWTYRDEDFGGTMAHLARTRGGPRSCKAIGKHAILRFTARNPLPIMELSSGDS